MAEVHTDKGEKMKPEPRKTKEEMSPEQHIWVWCQRNETNRPYPSTEGRSKNDRKLERVPGKPQK